MTDKRDLQNDLPADDLNQRIGVLVRREVEARILAPVIAALGEKFGREAVMEIIREVVVNVAKEQGRELARAMGGSSSDEFVASLQFWTKEDALEIEILGQDDKILDFDVRRCRYAEMYDALGIPELGALLSCNRDFALIDGFNGEAHLTRTQTIMEGASFCDFRYRFP